MKYFDGKLLSGYKDEDIRYEVCSNLGVMTLVMADCRDYNEALYSLSKCKGNNNFVRKIQIKEIIKMEAQNENQ